MKNWRRTLGKYVHKVIESIDGVGAKGLTA